MPNRTDAEHASSGDTAAALQAELDALKVCGASHSDAVRLHYIQSLLARSDQSDARVTQLLLHKARAALQSYQADQKAQQTHTTPPPQPTAMPANRSALALLIEQLDASDIDDEDLSAADTGPHESEPATQERNPQHLHTGATANSTRPAGGLRELKAARFFRDTLQQQRADTLLSRAIVNAPEASGPLNPQKLALRSLAVMRDLSPAYLGHFVSYFDTLLWLENIDSSGKSK